MLFSLTVGKVDAGVAVLLTEDKRLIEFPSILLPPDITSGSIVNVDVSRNFGAEAQTTKSFQSLQSQLLSTFGSQSPTAPVLRCRNATQTSIVLEWDPISLATASIRSLSLYRNGNKAGAIPRPLEITSTKISGLAVDTEYNFSLVLKTSAGTYTSEKLTVRTHKMTELHGITVTPGILPRETREELEEALDRIGGKLIEQVRIDTTHFVCTEGRGSAWEKATDMNIPIVLPDWVTACEQEGRLVGVRSYYLGADPRAQSVGSGPLPQSGGQRPAADRRASQPLSTRMRQPTPTTKITPPTPDMPNTPDTPRGRAAEEREPPSPFTKVEDTEDEKKSKAQDEKSTEIPNEHVNGNTTENRIVEDVPAAEEESSDPEITASTNTATIEAVADAEETGLPAAELIADSTEAKEQWAEGQEQGQGVAEGTAEAMKDPLHAEPASEAQTQDEETFDEIKL